MSRVGVGHGEYSRRHDSSRHSDNSVVHGVTEDPQWEDRLTEILGNRMEPVPAVERREAVSKGARIYVIDVVQGEDPPYADY